VIVNPLPDVSGFLQLAGGTMTGNLIAARDPSLSSEVATKNYVDLHSGGLSDAPSDGKSYGRLNGAWTQVLPITGGTLTGLLTLSGPPTLSLHAATKAYADTKLSDAPVDGFFYGRANGAWGQVLSLLGGTLSGPLILNADPTTGLGAATKNQVDAKLSDAPLDGTTYGRKNAAWSAISGGGAPVYVQDSPPGGVAAGSLWWESDTGLLYISYQDADSTQWVAINQSAPINAVQWDIAQQLSAVQRAQARANIGVTSKNYIINGGVQVSQENGTTASTANAYYMADQFATSYTLSAGVVSAGHVSATNAPSGGDRLRATVTTALASPAAADFYAFFTRIEGLRFADTLYGMANAKTLTLQFGCKGPAGTYAVNFRNSAINRCYVGTFTIGAGEANTDTIKSVTIPGDVTGTWLSDTGIGVNVFWVLMCGSTNQVASGSWGATGLGATGQSNFLATNGNVFELFDIGLYEGTVAPSFMLPDYASELTACQRYFENGQEPYMFLGGGLTTSNGYGEVKFATTKRAVPAMAVTGWQYWQGSGGAGFTPTFVSPHVDNAPFQGTGLTNWNGWTGNGTWKANARL
jgi:hypothetical protein